MLWNPWPYHERDIALLERQNSEGPPRQVFDNRDAITIRTTFINIRYFGSTVEVDYPPLCIMITRVIDLAPIRRAYT